MEYELEVTNANIINEQINIDATSNYDISGVSSSQ